MKKNAIIISSAILTSILIFLTYRYNFCSPYYANERKLIEHYFGIKIPNISFVGNRNVDVLDDYISYQFTPEEMTEDGIVYDSFEGFYDTSSNCLVSSNAHSLFNYNELQIIRLELYTSQNNLELFLPQISNQWIDYIVTSTEQGYIEMPRWGLLCEFDFYDIAEMRKKSHSGKSYQIGFTRNQRLTISPSHWGVRKIVIELSFTKWELEQLGIEFIPNTV